MNKVPLAEANRALFADLLPATHGAKPSTKRVKAPATPEPDPAAAEEQRLALELAASLTVPQPPA